MSNIVNFSVAINRLDNYRCHPEPFLLIVIICVMYVLLQLNPVFLYYFNYYGRGFPLSSTILCDSATGKIRKLCIQEKEYLAYVQNQRKVAVLKKRILIFTCSIGHDRKFFSLKGQELLKKYAEMHEYSTDFNCSYILPQVKQTLGYTNFHYIKMFGLLELIKSNRYSRFDYILWLDDDILVYEPTIPVESFVDFAPGRQIYFSSCKIRGFRGCGIINTGVMLMKVSNYSKQFLTSVIDFATNHKTIINDQPAAISVAQHCRKEDVVVFAWCTMQSTEGMGKGGTKPLFTHFIGVESNDQKRREKFDIIFRTTFKKFSGFRIWCDEWCIDGMLVQNRSLLTVLRLTPDRITK